MAVAIFVRMSCGWLRSASSDGFIVCRFFVRIKFHITIFRLTEGAAMAVMLAGELPADHVLPCNSPSHGLSVLVHGILMTAIQLLM